MHAIAALNLRSSKPFAKTAEGDAATDLAPLATIVPCFATYVIAAASPGQRRDEHSRKRDYIDG
jgi:hypothetical protein